MTDRPPRVSVIVPAYNAAAHLATALESVLAQTVDDWEVVVCDDGSRDSTAAIAQRYAPSVRLVRSPVNEGLACARNRAIAAARGELLALLDADDRWLPNYLESQLRALELAGDQRRVGIISCDAYIEQDGRRLDETYAERFGRPDRVTVEALLDISPVFISAVLPRRVLDEVGAFAPQLRSCEDLDLWIRIVEAGYRVVENREPLVIYRLSPGQLSAQPVAMARARRDVYQRALARGRLSRRQRSIARRAIRRERAIESASAAAAAWRAGERRLVPVLRALAVVAVAAIENPSRWRRWLRRGH